MGKIKCRPAYACLTFIVTYWKIMPTPTPLKKFLNQENKPWFDRKCKQARDIYFQNKTRLKRKRKGMQGQERENIKVDLAKVSGVYKKLLRKKSSYIDGKIIFFVGNLDLWPYIIN